MIASAIAPRTAARRPSRSNTSPTTVSAPAAVIAAVRDGTRVIATTVCPAATSCGSRRRPTAPLAPATKTLTLPRTDGVPDQHAFHELADDPLIVARERCGDHAQRAFSALARLLRASERLLRVRERHPLVDRAGRRDRRSELRCFDMRLRRTLVGCERKVDVPRKGAHDPGGLEARRDAVLVADVEARPCVQALLRDALLLLFLRCGLDGLVAAVFAATFGPNVVQLALNAALARGIGLVLHLLFEILFALRLRRVRDVDAGARVVAERAESATAKLELEQLVLHAHARHERRVAGPNSDAGGFDPLRIVAEVQRTARIREDIDAVRRCRHVELHHDTAPLEIFLQRRLVLRVCRSGRECGRDRDQQSQPVL